MQYYLAKCQQSKIRDGEIEYDLLEIAYFVTLSEVKQPGPQEHETVPWIRKLTFYKTRSMN